MSWKRTKVIRHWKSSNDILTWSLSDITLSDDFSISLTWMAWKFQNTKYQFTSHLASRTSSSEPLLYSTQHIDKFKKNLHTLIRDPMLKDQAGRNKKWYFSIFNVFIIAYCLYCYSLSQRCFGIFCALLCKTLNAFEDNFCNIFFYHWLYLLYSFTFCDRHSRICKYTESKR